MAGIDIRLNSSEIKRQVLESVEHEKGEKAKQAAKFAEDQLDHRARASFFAANPGASEEAYNAIEADLKKQIRLNDALDQDRKRSKLHSIYNEL